VVQLAVKLHQRKALHPQDRVYINQEQQNSANVRNLGQGQIKRRKNHSQTLSRFDEPQNPPSTEDAKKGYNFKLLRTSKWRHQ
jgi:hypothetical protein